jgi:Domain of unknown function (DUF4287)
MSFHAYLDNVEAKTGKTYQEFIDTAEAKGLTRHSDIIEWLKADFQLGPGHARAIAHVIRHGAQFEPTHTAGNQRDVSGAPKSGGPRKR